MAALWLNVYILYKNCAGERGNGNKHFKLQLLNKTGNWPRSPRFYICTNCLSTLSTPNSSRYPLPLSFNLLVMKTEKISELFSKARVTSYIRSRIRTFPTDWIRIRILKIEVSDQNPYWIPIHRICVSGYEFRVPVRIHVQIYQKDYYFGNDVCMNKYALKCSSFYFFRQTIFVYNSSLLWKITQTSKKDQLIFLSFHSDKKKNTGIALDPDP